MDTRAYRSLKRYLLRKASTQAVAEALEDGALDKPIGTIRHTLLRQSSRMARRQSKSEHEFSAACCVNLNP